ncbi:hypothetical protein KGM_213743B, partial [Danaus plexippus plexippus]
KPIPEDQLLDNKFLTKMEDLLYADNEEEDLK